MDWSPPTSVICSLLDRLLRASGKSLLVVLETRLSTKGDQAFDVRAPQLWNSLSESLRQMDGTADLKSFLEEMAGKGLLSNLEADVLALLDTFIPPTAPTTPENGQKQEKMDYMADQKHQLEEKWASTLAIIGMETSGLSLDMSVPPAAPPSPPLIVSYTSLQPIQVESGGCGRSLNLGEDPGLDQNQAAYIFPDRVKDEGSSSIRQAVTPPVGGSHAPQPVGFLSGEPSFITAAGITPQLSAPPPHHSSTIKSRRRRTRQEGGRPYVKQPLNAFMLFSNEQRPIIKAELNLRVSKTISTVLGQRWRALSKNEQDRYFEEAHRLRQLHSLQEPQQSAAAMKPSTSSPGAYSATS